MNSIWKFRINEKEKDNLLIYDKAHLGEFIVSAQSTSLGTQILAVTYARKLTYMNPNLSFDDLISIFFVYFGYLPSVW